MVTEKKLVIFLLNCLSDQEEIILIPLEGLVCRFPFFLNFVETEGVKRTPPTAPWALNFNLGRKQWAFLLPVQKSAKVSMTQTQFLLP